jgi:tetratricopeptide (TPR) repeat protein
MVPGLTRPIREARCRGAAAFLLAVAVLACAGSAPEPATPAPAPRPAAPRGESGSDTLLELAEQALERGDLDSAEQRFQRIVTGPSGVVRARVGLGRVALARGEAAAARAHFEQALREDPEALGALVGLAELGAAAGSREAARELLERAVQADPSRADPHARLAELTGRAPHVKPRSIDEALGLVLAHPYDPWALLQAGGRLARVGRVPEAVVLLEKAVWLADADPASATRALRLLSTLDEDWARRRVIRVHVYADETVRAEAAWRFRLRTVWVAASMALDGILDARFVPFSMRPFHTRDDSDVMEPLLDGLRESTRPAPPQGILAGFTARPVPRRAGRWKQGIAEFLGRRLLVRLAAGETQSRVLAHELLHLFGAVHVVENVESLMNPAGGSLKLDAANYRIVRSTRGRNFERGGFQHSVLPWIDLDATIEAYRRALQVNLAFRKAGIADALSLREHSRYMARREARRATELDPHLADVARMLARLMLADERRAEALMLFELAADLYGRQTTRGRAAWAEARALQSAMEERYGP